MAEVQGIGRRNKKNRWIAWPIKALLGLSLALGLIIGALIVIICFALITAMLILTMVETYIVVNAAIILLGFGPTRWTKDYAIRYLVYAGATGMKWFILLLVVGLGQALMLQWLNQYENNDTQVLLVVGAAVVLLALLPLPTRRQQLAHAGRGQADTVLVRLYLPRYAYQHGCSPQSTARKAAPRVSAISRTDLPVPAWSTIRW